MNELYILDAGRADCIVLFFDDDTNRRTVIIDGGTKCHSGKKVLVDFLDAHNISTIDYLILTHLHQDHFGGFYNLIDRFDIKKAVYPYGDIMFQSKVYSYYAKKECYYEYHAFYEYLKKCGTEITMVNQFDEKVICFGESTLSCIYPTKSTVCNIPTCIDKLSSPLLSDEDMEIYCALFKKKCNEESSIWALRHDKTDIALFAGDSTAETMNQALNGFPFQPEVLKLSHHGMNTRYFDKDQLLRLAPKKVVICNAIEYYSNIKEDYERVCNMADAQTYYTFLGDFCTVF